LIEVSTHGRWCQDYLRFRTGKDMGWKDEVRDRIWLKSYPRLRRRRLARLNTSACRTGISSIRRKTSMRSSAGTQRPTTWRSSRTIPTLAVVAGNPGKTRKWGIIRKGDDPSETQKTDHTGPHLPSGGARQLCAELISRDGLTRLLCGLSETALPAAESMMLVTAAESVLLKDW
jgi:hypothetical protein